MSTKPVVNPLSYIARIKKTRQYCAQMPLSSGGERLLRVMMIDLIDALLLASGDNDVVEELVPSNHSQVHHYPPAGMQIVPTISHIQHASPAVQMIDAQNAPSHMNPQVIARPRDAAPDVFLKDSIPTQSMGLPPGFTGGLPAGAPVPSTGFVKMIEPGVDPIAAMDDNG